MVKEKNKSVIKIFKCFFFQATIALQDHKNCKRKKNQSDQIYEKFNLFSNLCY